ncbi:sulfotransferase family protein [Cognatilysobacter segetis]|uniref:sulfotransferase family protein n=1 Tax=Cognatilysobacter segetis TaxID=2492394 RepID=UPI0013906200|nr:sulfotransferase [Lysobacter segetis]
MKPRVDFVIGGAQKAGTTALARYLSRHPDVALPARKEAHVFDAPDFDDDWGVAEVDARYAPHFPEAGGHALLGDATPIYMLHPRLIRRIARYNPSMRWIVLLRDPVDRAISQYHMERRRHLETWPLPAALALEPLRLAGHADDFSDASPLRTKSYLRRGRYADQLDAIHSCFPTTQVLVLLSDDLRCDPASVIARVCTFLEIPQPPEPPVPERVHEGAYAPPGAFVRGLARLLLWQPSRRLRQRYGISFPRGRGPSRA